MYSVTMLSTHPGATGKHPYNRPQTISTTISRHPPLHTPLFGSSSLFITNIQPVRQVVAVYIEFFFSSIAEIAFTCGDAQIINIVMEKVFIP